MAGDKETASGKRGTKIVQDFARDDSSMNVPRPHGKDLPDRGLSHSISGSVAPEK
jgi:hypothetical protein